MNRTIDPCQELAQAPLMALIEFNEAFMLDLEGMPRRYPHLYDAVDELAAHCIATNRSRKD